MQKLHSRLKYAIAPIGGIIIGLTSFFFEKYSLSSNNSMLPTSSNLMLLFLIPAACAMIETLAAISFYIPGLAACITFLSAIPLDHKKVFIVVVATGIGAAIGYALDIFLSRIMRGVIREMVRPELVNRIDRFSKKYGLISEILLSLHPNQMALLIVFYSMQKNKNAYRAYGIGIIAVMTMTALAILIFSVLIKPESRGVVAGYAPLLIVILSSGWLFVELRKMFSTRT